MQNVNLFDAAFIGLLISELKPERVTAVFDSGNDPGETFIGHMMGRGYLQQAMLIEALKNAGVHIGTDERIRWAWDGSFSEQFSRMLLKRVIGSLSLNQRRITYVPGSFCRALTLNYLLDYGHITRDALKDAVHDLLIAIGTASDELLNRNSTMTPKDLCSKHALGYAMHSGAIQESSWSVYQYTEQETPKDYFALAEGLLERVVEQLLTLEDDSGSVLAGVESDRMGCGSRH
ncbi:MAG: hypothetical protein HGB34_04540 [Candidatus Moranbacteria bacterium]|nr:hypothetical protein [Candidatus Moranbacteria bacterium]